MIFLWFNFLRLIVLVWELILPALGLVRQLRDRRLIGNEPAEWRVILPLRIYRNPLARFFAVLGAITRTAERLQVFRGVRPSSPARYSMIRLRKPSRSATHASRLGTSNLAMKRLRHSLPDPGFDCHRGSGFLTGARRLSFLFNDHMRHILKKVRKISARNRVRDERLCSFDHLGHFMADGDLISDTFIFLNRSFRLSDHLKIKKTQPLLFEPRLRIDPRADQ